MPTLKLMFLMLLSGLSGAAHAAQPYTTDDAAILEKGTCQLEVGRQVNRGNHELWLLPGCNFTGDFEVTLGKSRFNEAGSSRSLYVLQGKGLFSGAAHAPHAWGWVAGLRGHPRIAEDRRQLSAVFGSLLYTYESLPDRLLFHANIGTRAERDDRRHSTTWGAATEFRMTPRFTLIGEMFGDDRTRPSYQLGLRTAVLRDRFEFDISYGAENGQRAGTRWWTLGIRVLQADLF